MTRRSLLLLAAWLGGTSLPAPLAAQAVEDGPQVFVGGVPFSLTLVGVPGAELPFQIETSGGETLAAGALEPGETRVVPDLVVRGRADLPLTALMGPDAVEVSGPYVPGWFSLLPPIVAIALALALGEVIVSLLAGVWLGALAVSGFDPLRAIWRVVDELAVPALGDTGGQTQIVVFSLLLGGMVGIVSRNAGTRGIVNLVVGWATTRRRGKLGTWGAGLAIFFDDYANTLIVGNAMRPITDRLRISREKLAYLVDSTAAPVAAIVPISTWVGYEISLIADGLQIAAQQAPTPELAQALLDASPLVIFLQTIPYRFYPLLALFLAFLTSWTGRDLGPMADAERRAAAGRGLVRQGASLAADTSGEQMSPPEGAPERWWNAALPVLAVMLVVLGGLYTTGRAAVGSEASLTDVFGAADPFVTLLWGSLAGCVVAAVLSVGQRILSLKDTIAAWVAGMRAMVFPLVILVLAWSLAAVTEILGTAPYLAQVLSDRVPLGLLPALVFVTAAGISFATGTSWGTMAILLPLVVPLTVNLGGAAGFDGSGEYTILLGTISSVLAGAIFGDHCSPISDTTVLSSMASACDHVDHVRTQLPYAIGIAALTVPIGDVGTAYGLPSWVALPVMAALVWLFLRWRGSVADEEGARA